MMSEAVKTSLKHPEFQGRIGIGRVEITPPVGIYARLWGSAVHDVAEGVHQPLLATCAVFQDLKGDNEFILLTIDACLVPPDDFDDIRAALLKRFDLKPHQLMVHPSHTHSAPFTVRRHADRPGGHLIAPYLDSLPTLYGDVIEMARDSVEDATLSWAYGKCGLAFNRDSIDQGTDRDVCGLNVENKAEDTLLVGRITDAAGKIRGVIVNYACHPVSLGGQNRLISPDYIGTMREVIEEENKDALCLFLHGPSGDLTPRRSYEGNVEAAEQNGRELGYAALSVLTSMFPVGQELDYQGIEESGTPLGVWKLKAKPEISTTLSGEVVDIKLPLIDLPSRADLEARLAVATERFEIERIERSIARIDTVGDATEGDFQYGVWRLGDSFIVSTPAEPYSQFQVDLRKKYPEAAVAVLNLTNGFTTYLPAVSAFDRKERYQVMIALYEPKSLETVIERAANTMQALAS